MIEETVKIEKVFGQTVQLSEIRIGERFRKSVGSLSALVQSIKEVGLLHPIVVSEKNELIAGLRRIKAFELLGLTEIPCTQVNIQELRKAEKDENVIRLKFTPNEAVAVKKFFEPEEKEKAKQRILAGKPSGNFPGGQVRDIIAVSVGMSGRQLEKAETVIDAAEAEPEKYGQLASQMNNEEISVAKAYHKVKIAKIAEQTKNLKPPEGKFCTIVIDPPWPVEKIEREERPNQSKELDYPTMSLEEIGKLPIENLADEKGCHIYLWTTHKLLPEALKLFLKWNIKYQCLLTWVKPTGMTPFSWMYNTEHVLFGRIGNLPLLENGIKLSFEAPVTRHSEKPDVFYEKARKASPELRLEMFQRKPHEGFEGWGNEVEQ